MRKDGLPVGSGGEPGGAYANCSVKLQAGSKREFSP